MMNDTILKSTDFQNAIIISPSDGNITIDEFANFRNAISDDAYFISTVKKGNEDTIELISSKTDLVDKLVEYKVEPEDVDRILGFTIVK